ncbi:MAG: hypothetical protein US68_C0006G0077 [Candidatus Shapirobacteria bacterium GW2011_GWE1_38_10]|uniref:DNA polymerase III delta N-terminal domain-containing protein n=1 Tax=Candidatus Shapirobacteria bacterium GW2011_GWE1_38_10 TaxID=1618488 RepID=A0A0G0I767_9BACT|nr:MAG: hypothetical protein US46_C0002G0102 [Candidatus Shapirobacteria bacterium GW2011_GWF2_37_20]KKQ50397.1 MAG: hypothetical protein US68_C0006G0077 [Candidatus Shapirobacteria bacterium GW2011_GWE1_38_10]KKQ65222.1 MAG: hypothetical protein US85_C0001G0149 [Candidatus Shapirobacteria bacterium GW2011_GWF1_38_23]HBP51202.1 hypothetical protein [Candidatus Shapirobacteria bacterium]
MIYIFHGNHNTQSYTAFSELLNNYDKHEKFHQNGKNINPDSLDNFLNTPSLFSETKVVIFENLFSLLKSPFDKIIKLINSHPDFDYLFWQDKKIEVAKLKLLPQADIKIFTLPELLFSCLNAIKPKNKVDFSKKYQELMATFPLELALFWFKNTLRRQLTTYSKFSEENLKKAYLNLIELDKKSKSGTLYEPKDMAIERIILSLLDA